MFLAFILKSIIKNKIIEVIIIGVKKGSLKIRTATIAIVRKIEFIILIALKIIIVKDSVF